MQRLGVAGHAAEGHSRKSSGCLLLPPNRTSTVVSVGHTRRSLPQNYKKKTKKQNSGFYNTTLRLLQQQKFRSMTT